MPLRRKRLAIVARRARNSASSTDDDGTVSGATNVSTASVEQLRSLAVNKLCSHLKGCSLSISGTRVTMANRLHRYFHTSINTPSANSDNSGNSDNVAQLPLDSGSQQHTMETSVLMETVLLRSSSLISCRICYATCEQSTHGCLRYQPITINK